MWAIVQKSDELNTLKLQYSVIVDVRETIKLAAYIALCRLRRLSASAQCHSGIQGRHIISNVTWARFVPSNTGSC